MTRDMTTGSPMRSILAFAIPLFIGSMFHQFYHFADTIIVSRVLGEYALAAVGSIGPVNFLVFGFCNGVASGLAVPIAKSFGAKDNERLKHYVGNILWIYIFMGVVVTAISLAVCRPLLELTRTPYDIIDMAVDYLFIIFLGIPAMLAFNTLAGILRSLGDSRTPIITLIISSIVSTVLAFVFIYFFGWGVSGAALATIIAQALSAVGCLVIIWRKFDILHIKRPHLKLDWGLIKELLGVGVPMGLMFSVMGIGGVFLQASINALGSMAVAAVTAANRFDGLFSAVTGSIGGAVTVFCGQNLGAGKIHRIKQTMKTCVIIGLTFSLVAFVGALLFGRHLVQIFIDADSTQLIDMSYQVLTTVSAFYWSLSLVHIVRAGIQGMGYGKLSFVTGFLEMVGRGAVGLFFVPLFGFAAVGFAAPAAWLLAISFIIPAYFMILRHAQGQMLSPTPGSYAGHEQ